AVALRGRRQFSEVWSGPFALHPEAERVARALRGHRQFSEVWSGPFALHPEAERVARALRGHRQFRPGVGVGLHATKFMTGILLLDKPGGTTSHDVVARARRLLGERRIGHAGTLDPMATGLLVLVLGQATRLSSLLTGHDKTYDAAVRLGQATTTDDAEGTPLGEAATEWPADEAVAAALEGFRGTFAQRPPAHSAKK